MGFIIVTRNPRNKKILVVSDDDGEAAEFQSEHEAEDAAAETTVCKAWGYEVVEIAE